MRDVLVVLPDVSSRAAMAEAGKVDVCTSARLTFWNVDWLKDASGADGSRRESELKDTLKVAAHDSNLRSPRRKMGEHA